MARATNSFPVPLSPVIRTRLVCGATVWIKLEDGAHLRALPDDVVETREPPQFAAQVARLFLPLQAFGNLAEPRGGAGRPSSWSLMT